MPYDVVVVAPDGGVDRPRKFIKCRSIAEAERAAETIVHERAVGTEAHVIESGRRYKVGDAFLIGFRHAE
ncbi:MAG TPA: hypothetical protein VF183_10885, partial [Acidimicrobiales bacterium]